ncbi:MAG: DUF5686 family protein [Bacteroidia bacterium]
MKFLGGLFCSLLWAQGWVEGLITDEEGIALPFVTVRNLRTRQGTYTDLQGRFRIAAEQHDTLEIRCVGYAPLRIQASLVEPMLRLKAQPVEIEPVRILPGENPAHALIRRLQAGAERWNPLRRPHKYLSYNKLTLSLPDTVRSDTMPPYLLIWETETEKSYFSPNRYQEVLKAQRISGNFPIQAPFSPTTFLPISLYTKRITLLENEIASPIGSEAFEYYEYAILDTLYSGKDTLIEIEFFPRKGRAAWAMRGKLTIALPDGALYAIQAETNTLKERSGLFQTPFYRIWHYYERLGDTLWFPTQLHSEVVLQMRGRQGGPLTFLLRSRSFLRSVELIPNPENLRLPEVVLPKQMPSISYRAEELSAEEQRAYQVMDSLFSRAKVRRWTWLFDLPNLLSGRIGMGKLNLIIRPLILYHDAEGIRPQVGLETNDKLSESFRLRGWGGYGLYRWAGAQGSPWRYGAEIIFGKLSHGRLFYYDDVRELTLPRLIDESPIRLPSEQSAYEMTIRSYGFRWEDMVRERAVGTYAQAALLGTVSGYLSVAAIQRNLFAESWRGIKTVAGIEYIHRQTLLLRGGTIWRGEYALPRLHLQSGFLWAEGHRYVLPPFWLQIDLSHTWRWGRWAEVLVRVSTTYSRDLPSLWKVRLRTLSDSYLGMEQTLAAHPIRQYANRVGYLFFEWSIPNTRFPSPKWTPTITFHLQGAYADSQLYPEGGLSVQKLIPPAIERIFPSLRLVRIGLFVPLRASLLRERLYLRLILGRL